jgi:hypothetical protein
VSTRDVLIAARRRIERPECWTQGMYARDEHNARVPPYDRSAVCWCAEGAIEGLHRPAREKGLALVALNEVLPYDTTVWAYQDAVGRRHAEVLSLFDRAIEASS